MLSSKLKLYVSHAFEMLQLLKSNVQSSIAISDSNILLWDATQHTRM